MAAPSRLRAWAISDFEQPVTVKPIAAIPQIAELNIGHFLIGEAVFEGLSETVKFMRAAMDRGRKKAGA